MGNPTAGKSTNRRVTWSRFTPGHRHSGQESATATGAASMMVTVDGVRPGVGGAGDRQSEFGGAA
ncbi:hypothetical protein A606_02045 [Corynebacterium terpenotabidum Y-11]|uniref:Uncharacterized protein n=1 Tax=Corynebacterium terpenotabidum Y-11 TaxID=1200352 RepID=S4XAA5_9CORY|nr:hypothetical protein A606_02045 [Corynebacterium terpenotabidum Y-11]